MITNATSAATAAAAPSSAATGNRATPTLSSDFETFLKMLTAQARYQDPLEPIDSTEYAAQLAQFSMVEQQVQTNDTLTALFGQLGGQTAASLSAWVGMEARAVTPMRFDGSPITISPNPAAISDSAFLVVKDDSGVEVQRLSIPVSADPMEWAGVDDSGAPFASGTYSFHIESYKNDEMILSDPAAVYARVTEAQIEGANVILILEGGQAVLSTSVTALREPT
ncbi:flagellar hook capping FlgD N-terminal domain-containing protein [Arenibacterium sp. CAU 1754]